MSGTYEDVVKEYDESAEARQRAEAERARKRAEDAAKKLPWPFTTTKRTVIKQRKETEGDIPSKYEDKY